MPASPLARLQRALAQEAQRASRLIAQALAALARIHSERLTGAPALLVKHEGVLQDLAAALSRLQATGELAARISLRFPKAQGLAPEDFAAREPDIVPDLIPAIIFEEAVRDLEERDPFGAESLKRAGLEVEDVYGGSVDPGTGETYFRHGFALARAADAEVASKVKERLVAGLARGTPTAEVVAELQDEWGWPRSYAETVTRTSYNTATTAGRFREAERIQDAGIAMGMRFSCVLDSSLRQGRPQDNGENHRALDGLVARVDDPVWRSWSPPLGYNAVESGALVMTTDGPKPIEEVRVGDRVWTFQGEYARVYGVDAKTEKKRMVTIAMDGGHEVSVSVEHKVLTRRGWVHARNLRPDDEIAVSGCKQCGKHVPTWREFCGPVCRNRALAKAAPKRWGTQHRKGRACCVCGQAFDAANDQAKFCSWPCKAESQRDHRFCQNCGIEIKQRGKKKPHRFCSQKCNGVASRKPDRPCAMCGKSLRDELTKRGQTIASDRRFCSFRCWRRFNGESSIEKTVRLYLEGNGVHLIQSAQVGRFEVDFLLPTYAVAIECDGTYWHASAKVKARDARKDDFLRSKGYLVLRLPEEDIKASDAWKAKIHAVCEGRLDQARNQGSQAS